MALSELVLFVLVAQVAAVGCRHPSEATDVGDAWKTFRPRKSNRRVESVVAHDALLQQVVAVGNSSSPSESRDYSDRVNDDTDVDVGDDADDVEDDDERHGGGGGGGGHHGQKKKGHTKKKKKKKKKKHHGFFSLVKKMKKHLPDLMHKMHGPSMFMMGMAQANFHNFVMHALMMSKMALTSVVFMIIREMVFGDKDQPVKYYNFGYDHHRRTNHHSPNDYPYDYKRRRKRRLAVVA